MVPSWTTNHEGLGPRDPGTPRESTAGVRRVAWDPGRDPGRGPLGGATPGDDSMVREASTAKVLCSVKVHTKQLWMYAMCWLESACVDMCWHVRSGLSWLFAYCKGMLTQGILLVRAGFSLKISIFVIPKWHTIFDPKPYLNPYQASRLWAVTLCRIVFVDAALKWVRKRVVTGHK